MPGLESDNSAELVQNRFQISFYGKFSDCKFSDLRNLSYRMSNAKLDSSEMSDTGSYYIFH